MRFRYWSNTISPKNKSQTQDWGPEGVGWPDQELCCEEEGRVWTGWYLVRTWYFSVDTYYHKVGILVLPIEYTVGTSWYLVFVRLPSGYLELNRGSLSICLLTLYCTRSFNFNWFHTASHVCSQMKSTDEFWRYREAVTGYTRWANTSRTISKAI